MTYSPEALPSVPLPATAASVDFPAVSPTPPRVAPRCTRTEDGSVVRTPERQHKHQHSKETQHGVSPARLRTVEGRQSTSGSPSSSGGASEEATGPKKSRESDGGRGLESRELLAAQEDGEAPSKAEQVEPAEHRLSDGAASVVRGTGPTTSAPANSFARIRVCDVTREGKFSEEAARQSEAPTNRQSLDPARHGCEDGHAVPGEGVPVQVEEFVPEETWLHGRLQEPPQLPQGEQLQGLPARSGTGLPLQATPQLPSSCCVPPEWQEPLLQMAPEDDVATQLQEHDMLRLTRLDMVRNQVVYDSKLPHLPRSSMLPPAPHPLQAPLPPDAAPPAAAAEVAEFGNCSDNDEDDTTLVFHSAFESGNLRRAIQVYEHEYDLILRPDINTKSHTQWFYFRLSNTRAHVRYKFNIINMYKPDSLYSCGLQPLVHSAADAAEGRRGWYRDGNRIAYFPGLLRRKAGCPYYTLTFTLEFRDRDTVHIAHCYPYTYTNLQHYLAALEADPQRSPWLRRRVLCKTLAGNNCDLVTVTAFTSDAAALAARKGVVVTGRVHPGETNASWMMKGVLDFLTGGSAAARVLRERFVFKLVPMLNPDGVVNGNTRCGLLGSDLNRVWQEPSARQHPTIFNAKALIERFSQDREIALYCDLHGHSRKKDIFLYGCEKKGSGSQPGHSGTPAPAPMPVPPEKVLPMLLAMCAPQLFRFSACSFNVQKAKEGTARVVAWRELGIQNSYTLEASFAGPSEGSLAGSHFHPGHLETAGAALCHALSLYSEPDDAACSAAVAQLIKLSCDPSAPYVPARVSLVGTETQLPRPDARDSDSDDSSDDEMPSKRPADGDVSAKEVCRGPPPPAAEAAAALARGAFDGPT